MLFAVSNSLCQRYVKLDNAGYINVGILISNVAILATLPTRSWVIFYPDGARVPSPYYPSNRKENDR